MKRAKQKVLGTGLLVLTTLLALAACAPDPKSGAGFRLPDGNAEKGQQAFTDLDCGGCHAIAGEEAAEADESLVVLGGRITHVKTYGDLVTSIINPSHRISTRFATRKDELVDGESPMAAARLNEVMTVQQAVDLVAYLQGTYEVIPPEARPYRAYYP